MSVAESATRRIIEEAPLYPGLKFQKLGAQIPIKARVLFSMNLTVSPMSPVHMVKLGYQASTENEVVQDHALSQISTPVKFQHQPQPHTEPDSP